MNRNNQLFLKRKAIFFNVHAAIRNTKRIVGFRKEKGALLFLNKILLFLPIESNRRLARVPRPSRAIQSADRLLLAAG